MKICPIHSEILLFTRKHLLLMTTFAYKIFNILKTLNCTIDTVGCSVGSRSLTKSSSLTFTKIKYDFDLHPTNTWIEMEKLVQKGLVKNIGVSNFNSHQIQDILDKGKVKMYLNYFLCTICNLVVNS